MMDKTKINETLRRNVTELSKQTEREVSMMPATVAPLPSVDMVKRIVALVKNIIFPDYFEKRQPDEAIRSYHIGVAMEELVKLLTKQIAHGLQFCEHCEGERTKDQVYGEAENKALAFIDALPEIKRLLYTDVQAMFDNDPAAPNYGEVLQKRLNYIIEKLKFSKNNILEGTIGNKSFELSENKIEDFFVGVNSSLFGTENAPILDFITQMSFPNVREGLRIFKTFLVSGYTDVSEYILRVVYNQGNHTITIPIHEFVKTIGLKTKSIIIIHQVK